jgi:hypothetical protein
VKNAVEETCSTGLHGYQSIHCVFHGSFNEISQLAKNPKVKRPIKAINDAVALCTHK